MSVRLTSQESKVALFDSVTGTAFGPVFDDEAKAEAFLAWLEACDVDARLTNDDDLTALAERSGFLDA